MLRMVICVYKVKYSLICGLHFICIKQKETVSKPSAFSSSALRDKEPPSWRWDKQELERQVKDWKKKYEDLVSSSTDAKKDKDKFTLKTAKFGSAATMVTNSLSVLCFIPSIMELFRTSQ